MWFWWLCLKADSEVCVSFGKSSTEEDLFSHVLPSFLCGWEWFLPTLIFSKTSAFPCYHSPLRSLILTSPYLTNDLSVHIPQANWSECLFFKYHCNPVIMSFRYYCATYHLPITTMIFWVFQDVQLRGSIFLLLALLHHLPVARLQRISSFLLSPQAYA